MTTTATSTAAGTNAAVDYTTFDADNHYYEATDAYIRHMDKAMAKRAMQWAEINGRQRLLVGGKLNRFIPNPVFDPVAKPGSLDEYFRGKNPGHRTSRLSLATSSQSVPSTAIETLVCPSWTAKASMAAFSSQRLGSVWRKRSKTIHLHWWPPSKHSTGGSRTTGVMPTKSGYSRRR